LVLMAPDAMFSCLSNSDDETSNLIIWFLDILWPPDPDPYLLYLDPPTNQSHKINKIYLIS
jgi:hypothetical protein